MTGSRVLLVDDTVSQIDLLRHYLKDSPLEVQAAEGTAAAIRLLSQERFHAVLCDLVMPDGGGPGGPPLRAQPGAPDPGHHGHRLRG